MMVQHSSVMPHSSNEVFEWFSRPGAIRRLLPPWAPLQVLAEADSLREGTAVLGLPGGLRWNAQHRASAYLEGKQFVDELKVQGVRSAPFKVVRWRHEHYFEAALPNGTKVSDRIESNLPRTQIKRMLEYRHRQLRADLDAHERARKAGMGELTIAVSGSSGMVGAALCAFLSTGGHRVIKLVRRTPRTDDERRWNPAGPAENLFDGVHAVIHLAGASIFGRFTAEHRTAIESSRIEPTRELARLAARSGVTTFISASAIGIYGATAPNVELTELSQPAIGGADFLSGVVQRWEAAALEGESKMRRVQIRTGVVLNPAGGMLAVLRPIFSAGLGGRLGPGTQGLSWVGLDDLLDIYHRALWDQKLSGPINAVAPNPVDNAEFTRALAHAVRRPAFVPVPSAVPKLLLGAEGAQLLALADQWVIPAKLLEVEHHFRCERIADALAHCLGRS